METAIHELTAGYALDALDPAEREAFERHLAGCAQCQEELASFWEVTGALAVAADGPAPSPALRDRILEAARAERQTVVPLESRRRVSPRARGGHGDRGCRRDRPRHLRDLPQRAARRHAVGAHRAGGRRRRPRRPERDDGRHGSPARAGSSSPATAPPCSCSTSSPPRRPARPTRHGSSGQDARLGGNVRRRRTGAPIVPIPQPRAGRRGRRGDGRGRGRRELADAADPRCLGARVRPTPSCSIVLPQSGTARPARRRSSPARSRSDSTRTLVRMTTSGRRLQRALRLRRLPARAGRGRPSRRRGPRHARADADRLRQVAHLPARRNAAARADARPLAPDRADEGPGRQAAARDRRHGDVRQLVARRGGDGEPDPRRRRGPDADPLRGARAAAQRRVRRDAAGDRRRPRRDRRGALRQHVGPRLPARLPLHPPGARGARRADACSG